MEGAYLDVPVPLEVEHGERANVAQSVHVERELPEKVDDRGRTGRQRVPEHERGEDDREELLRERDDLHREQLAELLVHLLRVQLALPLVRHVVRVLHDLAHEQLRVEHAVLLRDHAPRGGEDRTKDGDVEEHGAVRGDLEVHEQLRVDHGGEHEDSGERAGDERDEPTGDQQCRGMEGGRAYLAMRVTFSFGNWPMYMLAVS